MNNIVISGLHQSHYGSKEVGFNVGVHSRLDDSVIRAGDEVSGQRHLPKRYTSMSSRGRAVERMFFTSQRHKRVVVEGGICTALLTSPIWTRVRVLEALRHGVGSFPAEGRGTLRVTQALVPNTKVVSLRWRMWVLYLILQ